MSQLLVSRSRRSGPVQVEYLLLSTAPHRELVEFLLDLAVTTFEDRYAIK